MRTDLLVQTTLSPARTSRMSEHARPSLRSTMTPSMRMPVTSRQAPRRKTCVRRFVVA